jgi:RimJ/RimL family protein N-acetyltransferase
VLFRSLSNQIEIKGILSHKEVCDIFITEYTKRVHVDFTLHTAMDIMRLDHLIKPHLKGKLMNADSSETEFLINCIHDFNLECLHETSSREELLERYQERISNHKFYIHYNEENIKTSIVMLSRDLKDGKAITAVYTLPEYRGKGYATSMMYYACEIIFNQGYHYATLFVDQKNPISNRVYQKIGFYILTNAYDYRLK